MCFFVSVQKHGLEVLKNVETSLKTSYGRKNVNGRTGKSYPRRHYAGFYDDFAGIERGADNRLGRSDFSSDDVDTRADAHFFAEARRYSCRHCAFKRLDVYGNARIYALFIPNDSAYRTLSENND